MLRPNYGSSHSRQRKIEEIAKKSGVDKYPTQRIRLPIIKHHKKASLYDHKERSDELSQLDDLKFQEEDLLT